MSASDRLITQRSVRVSEESWKDNQKILQGRVLGKHNQTRLSLKWKRLPLFDQPGRCNSPTLYRPLLQTQRHIPQTFWSKCQQKVMLSQSLSSSREFLRVEALFFRSTTTSFSFHLVSHGIPMDILSTEVGFRCPEFYVFIFIYSFYRIVFKVSCLVNCYTNSFILLQYILQM